MAFEAIIGSEPAAIGLMPRELTWQSSPGFENFARALTRVNHDSGAGLRGAIEHQYVFDHSDKRLI